MPMSFPDMKSLKNRATQRGFRQPQEGESTADYREAFALFMRDVDMVESLEIADGRGWDAQGPFALMEGLMKAKPALAEMVGGLQADARSEEQETVTLVEALPYPHLMITSKRDGELCLLFYGEDAEARIKVLAALMKNTPVARHTERFKDQITEVEMMSAAASRVLVSRLLDDSFKRDNLKDWQANAATLAAIMLVQDLPLNISISRLEEQGFALPA